MVYFSPLLSLPYFLSMGKNISGSNFITIVIYSLCIAFIAYFMAMYTNFNTGESEINQNRLILSLPVTRRSVINAKYIMISVWWLFSYTSHILIFILMNVVDTSMTFNQLLDMKVLLLSLCFTYLLMSIFYPPHISHLGRAEQKDFLFSFLE
ncbi:ABC-2 transporter permease [Anoxybacillus flavithermus]|uniref:ABC-2 transporter permease n=1 Tax=Anoxybacillus flavithermus TaxID=33934 RepID=UPI001E2EF8D5|nr:ABC-2 transporter permease [Anoxybacillus flavithermus]